MSMNWFKPKSRRRPSTNLLRFPREYDHSLVVRGRSIIYRTREIRLEKAAVAYAQRTLVPPSPSNSRAI